MTFDASTCVAHVELLDTSWIFAFFEGLSTNRYVFLMSLTSFSDESLVIHAAEAGHGLAMVMANSVGQAISKGILISVLDDSWNSMACLPSR
ncbi:hypothetical protein ACC668_17700 [Rhizobium ruizarguesonis]